MFFKLNNTFVSVVITSIFLHGVLISLEPLDVVAVREEMFIFLCLSQVSGAAPPKPCTSFAHFSFDEQLMHQIRKSEYTQPTPIQCQV